MNINIPDDHNPKYNISKEDLEKANELIRNMSLEKGDDLVIKDNMLIKKTKNYDAIWKAFLDQEEEEFKKKMKYGKEDIERIGVNEFIDFLDWRDENDISKWRTDTLHVIPCLNCQDAFAIFEHLALCKKCEGLYDLSKYWEDARQGEIKKEGASYAQLLNFTFNKSVRSKYLKGEKGCEN